MSLWESIPGRDAPLAPVWKPAAEDFDERWGGHAETFSSDTRLAVFPEVCWDVCGYYRLLRAPWKASRLELRRRYIEHGGPDDPAMTYALKQLLDPELRQEYDALSLGTRWLKDKNVQEQFKREAIAEAQRRHGAASASRVSRVLGEWGIGQSQPPAGMFAEKPAPPVQPWYSMWSYYVLGGDPAAWEREQLLPQWQAALVFALDTMGIRGQFAVGIAPDIVPEGFLVRASPVTGSLIIYLAGNQPVTDLAVAAAYEIKGFIFLTNLRNSPADRRHLNG